MMLAPVKSALLAFGISRGENAGLKIRWEGKGGGKVEAVSAQKTIMRHQSVEILPIAASLQKVQTLTYE
jgi:hypothetical protein